MFFACLCVFFHIVVDYIISQENNANSKISAAQSYPHTVIVCSLPEMTRGEKSSVKQVNSRNIGWKLQGLTVE